MSRRTETIAADYFDALYTHDEDPWRFGTSAYEQRKYEDTLGHLSRPRYASVLEVGCSIGVFTRLLAPRCDLLVAIDSSAVALRAAAARCADQPHVTFVETAVPAPLPAARFDLILLSEVLYYLVAKDVARTAALCRDHLQDDAELVLCHWLGETDYPLTGDEAATAFAACFRREGWIHHVTRRDEYRLDRLSRK